MADGAAVAFNIEYQPLIPRTPHCNRHKICQGTRASPVPSMATSWSWRFASTLVMPWSWCNAPEMSLTHPSQVMGTANTVCFKCQCSSAIGEKGGGLAV